MLSTFSAMSSSDGLFGIPFPAFEGGFTPWDHQEPLFQFPPQEPPFFPNKIQEPVIPYSGSEKCNPTDPELNDSDLRPGSDEPNRADSFIDERKRRRMISNRESARRSRMRKQKHLENLRNQVNRLKVGNRELKNRIRLATQHGQVVQRENERLDSESSLLRQRLWTVRQLLLFREIQQSQYNNMTQDLHNFTNNHLQNL